MMSWLLIRRLRGPAVLLLVGVTALLNQWDILSFGRSWPLYLILFGLFSLAERAALSQAQMDGFDPITGQPRSEAAMYATPGAPYPPPGTSIVPQPPSTPLGPDSGAGRP
jgi:Domain of unknown function (DUF5668)